MVQVVIQQLSGIGTVGALNLCDETLSNHFLSLKSQQMKLSIHHLKELLLVFLKDLRCCIKRERGRKRQREREREGATPAEADSLSTLKPCMQRVEGEMP